MVSKDIVINDGHYTRVIGECPTCGARVTRASTGTLQHHKANPRWAGTKKLHDDPPGPWCPGGGKQRSDG